MSGKLDVHVTITDALTTMALVDSYFFGCLSSMIPETSENFGTCAIYHDREGMFHLVLGTKFLEEFSQEEIRWIIAHEVSHVMFGHTTTRQPTDPYEHELANMAMDLEVNSLLPDNSDFRVPWFKHADPKWGIKVGEKLPLFPKNFNLPEKLTYEEYFELLRSEKNEQIRKFTKMIRDALKRRQQQKGSGQPGSSNNQSGKKGQGKQGQGQSQGQKGQNGQKQGQNGSGQQGKNDSGQQGQNGQNQNGQGQNGQSQNGQNQNGQGQSQSSSGQDQGQGQGQSESDQGQGNSSQRNFNGNSGNNQNNGMETSDTCSNENDPSEGTSEISYVDEHGEKHTISAPLNPHQVDSHEAFSESSLAEAIAKQLFEEIEATATWGNMPAEYTERVRKAMKSQVPWNRILRYQLGKFWHPDKTYTMSKPNKRFGYPFPGTIHKCVKPAVCYTDDSGSVPTKGGLDLFVSEVTAITKRIVVHLWTFDTEIHGNPKNKKKPQLFTKRAFKSIEFTGRGGTDFDIVLEHAIHHKYKQIIIFTDGECGLCEKHNILGMKIIWVITPGHDHRNDELPGMKIYMKKTAW